MADAPHMPLKPDQVIEIVLRRRWFIIIPFCLTMVAGIYLAFTLPKLYKASTLILIQPQKVPTSFVQPIVSSDMDARISTISQQIMSRSNLEKIIEQFDLFRGPEASKMFFEDKINALRERIKVDVTRSRKDADAFSISYTGQEPEKVMRIANTLASFFIDESLKLREETALGTSNFLDVELDSIRKRLEENEALLKTYRESFMGGLPEQLDTNLRILDRLQEQLSGKQEGMRDAQNRLEVLSSQLVEIERLKEAISKSPDDIMNSSDTDSYVKLAQLREQLAYLLTRYTERHPDIQRLQTTIARLEKDIADNNKPGSLDSTVRDTKQAWHQKKRQEDILFEIQTFKDDIATIQNQIQVYQKRVEDTPKREQELLTIKRDYQNVMDSYNSLLARKLEAELAVNMEKKQKGEQFRILDSARLPEKPVSPNMQKLFLIILAIGLGIGGGFSFLLEFFDQSFRRPDDVENFLGISVLATVPIIIRPAHIIKQRITTFMSIISVLFSMLLFAVFFIVTLVGFSKAMEFIHQVI
ncbi:MAG: protein GumC [Proteobacteria bacterium]|nr:protein GumC [Pseudomonadota bacterium]